MSGETKHHEECPVDCCHSFVVQPADHGTHPIGLEGDDLVDHDLRGPVEPVLQGG